jgi:hypothetical protein
VIEVLRRRVEDARRARTVAAMTQPEELERYLERTRPAEFLHYRGLAREKRVEVEALLAELRLDVVGLRVLDLGPAHGDSLDVFRERGAASCSFVERDAVFHAYNRLKGFEGHRFDLIGDLDRLAGSGFELVYAKGSVNPTSFRMRGERGLRRWLAAARAATAPHATLVIAPWAPVLARDGVDGHWFTRTLLEDGFEALPWIDGHNAEGIYPVTFVRRGHLAGRLGAAAQLNERAVVAGGTPS